MSENGEKTLEELLYSHKVSLENVQEALLKYLNSSNSMLNAEAINKIRRYGEQEYKRRFIADANGNISSHMKIFNFMKTTENQLIMIFKNLSREVIKIERRLDTLNSNPTE